MVYMLKTWQEPAAMNERLSRLEEQVFAAEPKKAVLTDGERKAIESTRRPDFGEPPQNSR
jgi:hypothetical protein